MLLLSFLYNFTVVFLNVAVMPAYLTTGIKLLTIYTVVQYVRNTTDFFIQIALKTLEN